MIKFLKIDIDSKRIFGLDILRAFAILFVIYQHAGNYVPTKLKATYNLFVLDGVSIFFVLSGFLIGRILIQLIEQPSFNTKSLFKFWKRRWLRTLPNYFLILLLLIVLNLIFTDGFTLSSVKNYFIFSQNLNLPHPSFFPEAWSLSIEEWFYFITPIGLFILIKRLKLNAKQSILILTISIVIVAMLIRYYKFTAYNITSHGDWDLLLRKQVVTRLDSIIFGVIGAYFQYYYLKHWIKHKHLFFTIGIALLALTKVLGFLDLKPVNGMYNCVFSFSVFAAAILFLLPYLSSIKHGKGRLSSFFSYTSVISYAIYILHLSVIQFWIIDNIDWSLLDINYKLLSAIKYSLFILLTFGLSTLLYKYFELPMMNLRDKNK